MLDTNILVCMLPSYFFFSILYAVLRDIRKPMYKQYSYVFVSSYLFILS